MATGDSAAPPRGATLASWQPKIIVIVLAGFALVFVGFLATAWPHTADDAYITLRYARHLADGFGVTWNPAADGARVEGYSNFLFVLLGAALIKLGAADPMAWLKALGAASAFGTLVVSGLIARRRFGPIAAATVVAAFLAHPGQAFWAVSGMETTVCQFLIVLAVWATLLAVEEPRAGREARRLRRGAALALFGASLARPESPIVLAALLAFTLATGRHRGAAHRARAALELAIPFVALYLPYTAWRVWTFGRWLPNSAACKAGYATDLFSLGREFLGHAWPFLALGILGVVWAGDRERRRDDLLLLGIPVLYLATFWGVHPVMSHLDRHFLAALPMIAIAGVFGLFAIAEKVGTRLAASRTSTTSVLLSGAILLGSLTFHFTPPVIERAVELAHPLEDVRRELGIFLRERLEPGDVYAIGDTGLVPFLAGGTVLDVYCLNCREATEPPIDRDPERLAEWILAQRPRYVVVQAVRGGAERGVWPADRALQAHAALGRDYARVQEFGDANDPLRYLVFERRVARPRDPSRRIR